MIGAGTLVPLGMVVPERTLVLGRPGRVIRDLTEEEWTLGRKLAERYVGVARDHQRSLGAG
jgi:carbonic anhydrase/acetyltransferase-like protein (isoleucine patch superfamily)